MNASEIASTAEVIDAFARRCRPRRETLLAMRGDQRGATAVEYGLIVALCVVAMLGAVELLGGVLEVMFEQQAESIHPGD